MRKSIIARFEKEIKHIEIAQARNSKEAGILALIIIIFT
jgi:hypothetical protein